MVFKAGRETKRIKGANQKELNEVVKQLAQEAAKAGDSGIEAGSSSSGGRWAAFAAPRGYTDITDSVDTLGLDFLNMDGEKGEKRCLFDGSKPASLSGKSNVTGAAGGKKDWIESDTDEQLMLFVPFQSTVKLHSIHITSIPPAEDSDEGGDERPMRPKTLKLYTNRSNVIGFDEADDLVATQEFTLSESDWDAATKTAKLDLRFVKFQNISSLVVFVVDGDGDGEKTRIDRVRMFGETGEKRSMGKLEKVGDEQGE